MCVCSSSHSRSPSSPTSHSSQCPTQPATHLPALLPHTPAPSPHHACRHHACCPCPCSHCQVHEAAGEVVCVALNDAELHGLLTVFNLERCGAGGGRREKGGGKEGVNFEPIP